MIERFLNYLGYQKIAEEVPYSRSHDVRKIMARRALVLAKKRMEFKSKENIDMVAEIINESQLLMKYKLAKAKREELARRIVGKLKEKIH
jgi:hypothetical protein